MVRVLTAALVIQPVVAILRILCQSTGSSYDNGGELKEEKRLHTYIHVCTFALFGAESISVWSRRACSWGESTPTYATQVRCCQSQEWVTCRGQEGWHSLCLAPPSPSPIHPARQEPGTASGVHPELHLMLISQGESRSWICFYNWWQITLL
jgi:hypothetical protein